MAEDLDQGLVQQWRAEDEPDLPRDGSVQLVDVRTQAEYAAGHIDGFINLPVDQLREHLEQLDKTKPVYLVCQSVLAAISPAAS